MTQLMMHREKELTRLLEGEDRLRFDRYVTACSINRLRWTPLDREIERRHASSPVAQLSASIKRRESASYQCSN